MALNLGYTIHATENISFGPSAGLNYTTGEVDGYTERNGGLANLIYPDHDFKSMIGRLGGYATFKTATASISVVPDSFSIVVCFSLHTYTLRDISLLSECTKTRTHQVEDV